MPGDWPVNGPIWEPSHLWLLLLTLQLPHLNLLSVWQPEDQASVLRAFSGSFGSSDGLVAGRAWPYLLDQPSPGFCFQCTSATVSFGSLCLSKPLPPPLSTQERKMRHLTLAIYHDRRRGFGGMLQKQQAS